MLADLEDKRYMYAHAVRHAGGGNQAGAEQELCLPTCSDVQRPQTGSEPCRAAVVRLSLG